MSLINLSAVLILASLVGCGQWPTGAGVTWHHKLGWNAEDYFSDAKVIALCKAIEANDIAEIDRLVAAGADVNAKGKGNMTPLLWAYPDNKLDRFKKLLELGADPNVVVQDDFNTRGEIRSGDSVTHMACQTSFPGYFEAVYAYGGDPNQIYSARPFYQPVIFALIQGSAHDKLSKIKTLVEKGANLDQADGRDGDGLTPAMSAVILARYDIALELLQSGANPNVYRKLDNQKLVHIVVADAARRSSTWTPQQRTDYAKLVEWLKQHGQSIEEAEADQKRWHSWSGTTGEYQRKMAAEVAARKAKEENGKAASPNATGLK